MKKGMVRKIVSIVALVHTVWFVTAWAQDATDEFIKKCVEDEIAKQVDQRVQQANKRIVNLKQNIKNIVNDEVTRQVSDIRKDHDCGHLHHGEGVSHHHDKHHHGDIKPKALSCSEQRSACYIHPLWPYYSQFYNKKDFFQFTFMYETASQAYSSSGKTRDVFNLGCKKSVKLKDILLVSKLASEGKLNSSAGFATPDLIKQNHYLSFMADLPIVFDGSQDFYRGEFNWARHYWNGDVSIGVNIPLAIKHIKMKIKACLPEDVKTKIANVARGLGANGQPVFFNPTTKAVQNTAGAGFSDQTPTIFATQSFQFNQLYSSFENFVATILDKKDIDLKRDTTSLELGDIGVYANFNLHSRYYKEGVVGVNILLPSAQRTDGFALFDPAVGNNGTTQLSLFASFLWSKWWWCNPHLHMTGTYSFPSRLRMRVPKLVEQGKPDFVPRELLLGSQLQYTDQKFMELDATVKGFADTTSRVRVTAAPELLVRLGNVIEHAGIKNAFLDLYYDFFVKGKSSHSRSVIETSVATGERVTSTMFSLNDRTWEVHHRLGADYSYQFNDKYRARLGLFYNVAGGNAPKTLGVAMSINVNFD